MSQVTYERVRAFIVTPFGKKKDSKGNEIDFKEVYDKLIDEALRQLAVTGRTTGEIVRAGSIHADMFERLLTADLVVAEVSIHNANVFYELGIRHALRQHGTVMIRGEAEEKKVEGQGEEGKKEQGKKNDDVPFDIHGFRYVKYDRDDPAGAVAELVDAIRATLDTPDQDSPVFRSLPNLREQDRSRFLTVPPDFREEVELALANKQRGDLSLLALETQGFSWGIEGLRVVGRAQFSLGDWASARATWEEVRDVYPGDKDANMRLGTIYQKLGDLPASDVALGRVLANRETTPYEKAEAYSLQGSNAKARWRQEWQRHEGPDERRAGALRSGFLQESFRLYERGFGEDLNHFYSGLNALAMLTVTAELARQHEAVWAGSYWPESDDEEDPAADALKSLTRKQAELAPSVLLSIRANIKRLQWEMENAPDPATRDDRLEKLTWARISEADHSCLTARQSERVGRGYRNCLKDVQDFYKRSAHDQLLLYKSLGILEKNVEAGLLEALAQPPDPAKAQPHVFVFTGHRVDDPGRAAAGKGNRFPAEMEPVAREAIRKAVVEELETLGEGNRNAVGIAGGASGGDILFHEVCRELGIKTYLYLALPRADYITASVQDAGPEWVRRFNQLYDTLEKRELSRSKDMPRWLREKGGQYGIWQRGNLWILTNAVALDKKGGGSNLTLIALWNGKQGDGAGGTEDMTAQARKRGARTRILPTEQLFGITA